MSRFSLYATAATAVFMFAAAPAYAIKPANLEQTKNSNAGAGNGGEAGAQIGDPVTVVTEREVTTTSDSLPYDETTSGDLPTIVDKGPWVVQNVQVLNSGNIKYTLERVVETTTGTYTETTTYVTRTTTTDTYEDKTITTTFEDVDPGNSGGHNRAPEADEVVTVEFVEGTVPVHTETSEETVQVGYDYSEDTTTTTSTDNKNVTDNNPHVGDNYGVGDEFPASEIPGGGA